MCVLHDSSYSQLSGCKDTKTPEYTKDNNQNVKPASLQLSVQYPSVQIHPDNIAQRFA